MKNINDLICQLNIKSDIINFDNAALSYIPKCVMEQLKNDMLNRNLCGPEYDKYWKQVEEARRLVAKKIGASEKEIFFIQNTSMGINFAAKALPLKEGDEIITTDLEFPSNVYPWMNLESNHIHIKMIHNYDGIVTAEDIINGISERTAVVAVNWVVAANGLVLDIEKIGKYCKEQGIYFVVDGIQGLGAIPIDVKKVQCDMFVSGFFKWMMGPDGIAFVYIREDLIEDLQFPWLGWAGMKHKFDYATFKIDPVLEAKRYETGNMNFSALQALVPLLHMTDGWESAIYERVQYLVAYLRKRLREIEQVVVVPNGEKISGITLIKTIDDEKTGIALKKAGFRFSMRGGLRLSLHFYNTEEEIDRLIDVLKKTLGELENEAY